MVKPTALIARNPDDARWSQVRRALRQLDVALLEEVHSIEATTSQMARFQPDLLLTACRLDGESTAGMVAEIRRAQAPETSVVAFTDIGRYRCGCSSGAADAALRPERGLRSRELRSTLESVRSKLEEQGGSVLICCGNSWSRCWWCPRSSWRRSPTVTSGRYGKSIRDSGAFLRST